MNIRRVAFVLIAGLIAAGCLQEDARDPPDDAGNGAGASGDPEHTFAAAEGGTDTRIHRFDVPAAAEALRIALNYTVGGVHSVSLEDPAGETAHRQTGPAGTTSSPHWYEAADPAPGTWEFRFMYSGGVSYTVEVFY